MKTTILKTVACFVASAAFTTVFAADAVKGAETLKKHQCASCHGDDFVKSADASIPSLAGQHADYLVQALRQYKNGDNKNALVGRANAVMGPQAKKLSNADIDNIAAYLSGLKGQLSVHK
jgi:cytochrome c553